ncbi:SURF1 family cytochrome oxidase biogenesis protein [Methylobacterium sp. E-016]|uniref:SURF1 family cytochrome oxidase biogenesis protein n=1 Tax=Methylobacterium sp. E-016 TaxID=2836556 RepID=UPI002444F9BC|nr:SURF1 family cytochrome oxidase biogenesis protein [Methylobacterium sp. E-016]
MRQLPPPTRRAGTSPPPLHVHLERGPQRLRGVGEPAQRVEPAALAAARRLSGIAPYFADADASADGRLPVGGLPVVAFPNSHPVYALTWFTLAAMTLGAASYVNVGRRG